MINLFNKDSLKKIITFATFLLLVAVFVNAAGWPYAPGDTLDPGCNPGDVDCVVTASSSGVMQIGNQVVNGTTGSLLFVGDIGELQENNNNLFWSHGDKRLGVGTNNPTSTLFVHSTLLALGSNTYSPQSIKYSGGKFDLDDATFDYSGYSCAGGEDYRVSISSTGANDEFMWSARL